MNEVPVEINDFYDTFDGVRIKYYQAGKPSASRPTIVLANGLGGTWVAWTHYIRNLVENGYHVVSWDYRGTYESDPADLDALGIESHISDMERLLDHLKIKKAILSGWSMGVAMIFEYWRNHEDQVVGLIPICGSPGDVFTTLDGVPMPDKILPPLFRLMQGRAGLIEKVVGKVTSWDGLPELAVKLGAVAPSVDTDLMRRLMAEFGSLNVEQYYQIMLGLGEHSAWDLLDTIDVPALIVAGTKDFMTPASVARETRAQISGAELFVIVGGTHYAPIEFPDLLNQRVNKFLETHFPVKKAAAKKKPAAKKPAAKKAAAKKPAAKKAPAKKAATKKAAPRKKATK